MDVVRMNNLYDRYSELFTEKQRNYFEDYYFNDLSLSEIAENNNISRNAVHKQIKDVESKLEIYESKLGIFKRSEEIMKVASLIEDEKIKEKLIKII